MLLCGKVENMLKVAGVLVVIFAVVFAFSLTPVGRDGLKNFSKTIEFDVRQREINKKIFEANKHKLSTVPYSWAKGEALPEPKTLDGAYVVVNKGGEVVYDLNPDERRSPASLTKLVVAMVAIDLASSEDMFEVKKEEVRMEPTIIMVDEGERFTRDELLAAMLLTSANDAAAVLARGIAERMGGSRDLFIDFMNEKVKNFGLVNTHFKNPTGYDEQGQYSTARDLAKIAYYALEHYPLIKKLVKTKAITLQQTKTHKYYELPNWNGLLGVYPGVDGVKIGYTEKAGYVTIVTSSRGNARFMVVLLDAPDRRARDFWAAQLLNAAFANVNLKPFHLTLWQLKKREVEWTKQLERAKEKTNAWRKDSS